MHDVDRERHDHVARQENDTVMREPLAAEPLPVDEAGLEHGRDARPDPFTPEQRTAEPVTAPVPEQAAAPAAPVAPARHADAETGHGTELFTGDTVTRLRARWRELQADFVDDPERAVREADEVLDEVVRTIAERRQQLSGEWQGHTDTEQLRLAMREYRSFVDRLLPTT